MNGKEAWNNCTGEIFKSWIVKHQNLQLLDNGLYIYPKWPFIGASPDNIIACDCCAKGVVEIKCPYKHWENTIEHAAVNDDKQFCH